MKNLPHILFYCIPHFMLLHFPTHQLKKFWKHAHIIFIINGSDNYFRNIRVVIQNSNCDCNTYIIPSFIWFWLPMYDIVRDSKVVVLGHTICHLFILISCTSEGIQLYKNIITFPIVLPPYQPNNTIYFVVQIISGLRLQIIIPKN